VLNNASSELKVLESAGGTYYGSIDVGDLTADRTYTFPDASGTVCLSTGNCAGAGGGITGSGTTNTIAKFTGAGTIGDSSISDNGTNVTLNGTANLVIQGGNATFGTTTQAGSLTLSDGSSNTVSIVVSAFAGNYSYTIPDVGSAATFCLSTGNCVGGSGGGAPNAAAYLVASLDGTLTSERALAAGTNISLTDGGANSSFTVATVNNPSFSTSVTTPLLQSSGVLTLTSASGQILAVDAGTTIELQDSTNVTGSLDVSAALNVGTSNAFQVNSSGAITAATGITSSGTITFSGLNCTTFTNGGALTTDASGNLTCSNDDGGAASSITGSGTSGTIPLFNGTNTITDSIVTQSGTTVTIAGDLTLSTALAVAQGGTGHTSFTSNGLLYGNGSGALQVTAAGTSGQVLVASALGVPTFVSFSGDVAVTATGATTIQADSVALGTDTTGNYVANLGTLTGLTTSGNSGEGSTPTLSVTYGSGANTAVQGNTGLTCASGTGNLSGGGTAITLGTGGTCGSINTVANPTFTTSVTTPLLQSTAGLAIQTGGGANNITLGSSDTTGTLLVLDVKTSAGDPTGVNGGMYYNSSAGKFRCYEGGSWTDCIPGAGPTVTLQTAYNNSTDPEIVVGSAATSGISIRDNATPISGKLFEVTTNGGGTSYFNVDSSGVFMRGVVDVVGTVQLSGSQMSSYTTPGASPITLNAKLNVGNGDPGSFGQMIAAGLSSTAQSTSRGLAIFDARTGAHEQTLVVLNPSENRAIGLSWNGSDTSAALATNDTASIASAGIVVQSGGVSSGTGLSTGSVSILSGSGTGTNTSSGNVIIDAGAQSGTGTNGTVTLGTTNASAVTIGRQTASGTTTINGGTGGITLSSSNGTTVSSTLLVQPSSASTSAFLIQSPSAADTLLSANTTTRTSGVTGNMIKIGNSTGTDTALTILQVDSATANPTTNLASLNGGLFYNSTTNKLSIIENGQIKIICNTTDLGCGTGTVTLQTAYTNSTNPEIVLDATRGALTVRDASSALGANLFEVQNNAGTTSYLAVTSAATTLGSNVDLIMQGATAYISNPQGQTASESFGLNATVAGANSLAVGNGANSHASGASTAIGTNASSGANGVALGYNSASQGNATALGTGATADSSSVAIGRDAVSTTNSIALGRDSLTTASNQFVVGSGTTGEYINRVVVGSGVTDDVPVGFTLQGTGGSGTNIAGASVTIAGGQGTGNTLGGSIIFQSSLAGASGAGLNALTTLGTLSTTSFTLGTNLDLLLQGATAYISNPQTQSQSEAFGLNASVTGANAVAVGYGALAGASGVAIGQGAAVGATGGPVAVGQGSSADSWGVAIGQSATTVGNWATAIGNGASASLQNSVALGNAALAKQNGIALGSNASNAGNNQIAIGFGAATTADNQLVIGGSATNASYISDAYLGSGVTDTTPQSVTLQGTGGSGANIAGAAFNLAGGKGTGTGNGGGINLRIAAPGSAGSSLNTLTTVAAFSGSEPEVQHLLMQRIHQAPSRFKAPVRVKHY
jgi:hypothetical protein